MVSETVLDSLLPREINGIFTKLFLRISVAFPGPPTNSFLPNTLVHSAQCHEKNCWVLPAIILLFPAYLAFTGMVSKTVSSQGGHQAPILKKMKFDKKERIHLY